MPVPEPRQLIAVALLIALPSLAAAQEREAGPALPTLAEAKMLFTAGMRTAIAPAGRKYLAELNKLERQFASEGKYEAAIEAREEAAALSKFLGGASGGAVVAADPDPGDQGGAGSGEAPAGNPTQRKYADTAADISEGARFTGDGLALQTGGATASWQLGDALPGGYEIELRYSSTADTSIRVKEEFFRISTDLPATGGRESSLDLGTLKITDRSDAISVVHMVESSAGEEANLIIHSVRLVSAKN